MRQTFIACCIARFIIPSIPGNSVLEMFENIAWMLPKLIELWG